MTCFICLIELRCGLLVLWLSSLSYNAVFCLLSECNANYLESDRYSPIRDRSHRVSLVSREYIC